MSFFISLLPSLGSRREPVWDALPVAKIINYPLERADYKPFAQARLCLTPDTFYLRLWAFEVYPEPSSSLAACFALPEAGAGGSYLRLELTSGGVLSARFHQTGGGILPVEHRLGEVKTFQGEDLQGIYWGGVIRLPVSLLSELFGGFPLGPGEHLKGNLYKLCTGERPHYGCFYPVDFQAEDPFSPTYYGDFLLIEG